MRALSVGVLAAVLVGPDRGAVAADRETVFAVARVEGKTKTIDGRVYHLVAIKLEPRVRLSGSGLTNPVLLVAGAGGKAELADGDAERELGGGPAGPKLLWLRLPADGTIEVVWGALRDPKEKDAELRGRLVKAGYAPFTVDVRKLPVVKAGTARELAAALD